MILEVSLPQSDLRELPAFFTEMARCFGLFIRDRTIEIAASSITIAKPNFYSDLVYLRSTQESTGTLECQ